MLVQVVFEGVERRGAHDRFWQRVPVVNDSHREVVAPDSRECLELRHLQRVTPSSCSWRSSEEFLLVEIDAFVHDIIHGNHVPATSAIL